MKNRRTRIWLAVGAFAVLVPLALLAYEYGPDPRYTGAPGDNQLACANSGCHTGLAAGGPINKGGGGVTATFSSGTTYTPGGPPITITVTVTDPVNIHYGFQMTARPESNLSQGQAGDFTAGTHQLVICDDGSVKSAKGCPSSTPVEFIEHDYPAGSQVSTTPYTFTWTPPATNIGNVHFYVAGNAVNGNLQADAGDHVYTNSFVLTPAVAFTCTNTTAPVITSVDSASGYGGYNYFASGTWLEIKGSNLADASDPRLTAATNPGQWTSADFNGSNAPTSLDGISVSVNGKAAYVWYLSTGQLNVQAPEDTATGSVAITVTNCKATSSAIMFTRRALAPGFLAPSNYTANGTQYMVATFQSDGAYVLNTATGASFGLISRPAKPGDGIILYGIGFGDVTPAILPGVIAGASNTLVNPVTISFGSTQVSTPAYQGLAGGFVGLYEFYITVPSGLANGDYQINVTQNGTTVPQTMSLTVHN
ncbi:MAG TPA: choice-of-anchor V domain-containing protein [Bryobacteraceae bacterium]|jgi:uncharacterized protein (TIGR03437 family)|nr:choice-of-anchor V domain-containing protein [Bryobacteraceae bacterium]